MLTCLFKKRIFETSSGVVLARSFETTRHVVLKIRSVGTLVAGTGKYLKATLPRVDIGFWMSAKNRLVANLYFC